MIALSMVYQCLRFHVWIKTWSLLPSMLSMFHSWIMCPDLLYHGLVWMRNEKDHSVMAHLPSVWLFVSMFVWLSDRVCGRAYVCMCVCLCARACVCSLLFMSWNMSTSYHGLWLGEGVQEGMIRELDRSVIHKGWVIGVSSKAFALFLSELRRIHWERVYLFNLQVVFVLFFLAKMIYYPNLVVLLACLHV